MAEDGVVTPTDVATPELTVPSQDEGKEPVDKEEAAASYNVGTRTSEVSRRGAKKGRQRVQVGSDERVDVDRTALNKILDVSSRIQDIQKKNRLSMSTLALAHESYKDKQAKAKEARTNRMGGIRNQHRFLLDNAAMLLNKTPEYVMEGVCDADSHIDLLDSAIAEGGRNCIVLCDASLPPVNMESGRFIYNQKGTISRIYISDCSTVGTQGNCVVMYRIRNKLVDAKNVADLQTMRRNASMPNLQNILFLFYNSKK